MVVVARKAWHVLAASASVGARPLPDAGAWMRARTRPWRRRPDVAEADALLRRDVFLAAARPYADALSRAAGGRPHRVELLDEHRVRLYLVGVSPPSARPGARSAVSDEGTSTRFEVPDADGRPRGALILRVGRPGGAASLHDLHRCAAHGIQAELLRARLPSGVGGGAPFDDGTVVPRLRDDIVQAHAAARIRLEAAALLAARGRDGTHALVALAEASFAHFRRRASLWLLLGAPAAAGPAPVDLVGMVHDLVDLLGTEAAVRGITLQLHTRAPCRVVDHRSGVGRALLRFLLDALDVAGAGGAVGIDVTRLVGGAVEIRARCARRALPSAIVRIRVVAREVRDER